MSQLYYVSVTLHVLASMFWLGGMLFLGLVGAPVLRGVDSPLLRQELFRRLGQRFRALGWAAIGVMVVTGLLNLQARGLLWLALTGSEAVWGNRYGQALAWKLAIVLIMLTLQAFHDFVHGPRASRLEAGSPQAERMRRWAARVGRLNSALAVFLVYFAVRLARGG